MAVHIKNMKELNKALQPVMMGMVDKMAERVYETLNYFLQDYYAGYEPSGRSQTPCMARYIRQHSQ